MPRLADVTEAALASAFRVGPDNPLVGVAERAALLRRLGAAVDDRLGGELGNLFDLLPDEAAGILDVLLDVLAPIWPGRLSIDGVSLGDAWRHPAIRTRDRSNGVVPFHKLSQWLTYSLIEPIEQAGLKVTHVDGLTGLPEYRNGGLLIDMGVIVPRAPLDPAVPYEVGSELIVEWRALTVALLDRLREATRRQLGLASLAISQLLQGGTWSAGRAVAMQRRPPDGLPPIAVRADGTVF